MPSIKVLKSRVSPKARKLNAQWTIELSHDLHAMYGIHVLDDWIEQNMSHLEKLQKRKLTKENQRYKATELEKIVLRREIKLLGHQIENHIDLFPEYYL